MTSKSSRRLAAIMFTDIVGYTALMGQNEQDALEILERNRKIHNMLISRFNGKLLKEMGDGIMASFTNTYSAIMCAAAIQKESQKQGYQLKIGLHEGDVVEKNGDIFGEGVNIASRVEALADPEQILITETIYRNIHNKPGIITELLGEKYLKNVSDSWKIYASYVDEKTLERELMVDHNPVTEDKRTVLKGLIKWLVIGFVGLGAGGMLWMNVSSSSKVEGFTAQEVKLLRDKTITVLPFTGPESEWLDKIRRHGTLLDIQKPC